MAILKSIFLKRINYIPLIIIAFINFIFSFKYLSRIYEFALPLSLLYFCLLIFIPCLTSRYINKKLFSLMIFAILLLVTIIYILLLYKIPVYTLYVDRWSVIENFWGSLLQGKYPYMARSHMNNLPGAFPFYFVLLLPFYYIHEIGYFPLLAILLLTGYIYKKCEKEQALLMLFIILFSVCIAWEVVARSTILGNSILLFIYLHSFINADVTKKRSLIFYGIIGGLLLSIRGLAAMPILIIFAFLFVRNKKWKDMFTAGISLCASFISTFVPLFLFYPKLFITQNPFILQANFLPFPIVVFFMITALVVGIKIKTSYSVFLYSGLILFFCVLTYFIIDTAKYGFVDSYFGSYIDISYSIFSFPFLLYCICKPSTTTTK